MAARISGTWVWKTSWTSPASTSRTSSARPGRRLRPGEAGSCAGSGRRHRADSARPGEMPSRSRTASASGSSARGRKIGSGPSVITRILLVGPARPGLRWRGARPRRRSRSGRPTRTAAASLSRQASRPLRLGKTSSGWVSGSVSCMVTTSLAHVPDREEAVGGREVHEVDPGPGDGQAHRDHVAPAPPALGRRRPARGLAHIDDHPLETARERRPAAADGRSTKTVN